MPSTTQRHTILRKKIGNDISPLTHECVKRYISGLQVDKIIDEETAKYLKENSPKPGRFFTIPKLHKQDHPGRPIVSSNSHPTERISQLVDFHLQPLVTKLPSYIKDFLNKLNSIGELVTRQILGRQRQPEVGSKVLYLAKTCTFRAHNSESSLPECTP